MKFKIFMFFVLISVVLTEEDVEIEADNGVMEKYENPQFSSKIDLK